MYEKLSNLNSNQLDALQNLCGSVSFTDKNIRMGASGTTRISKYVYSRWYDWNRQQKLTFKNSFDPYYSDNALVGWFLKFPANQGFLDLMNYWTDKKMAGNVIAYSLTNNTIVINSNQIAVKTGEGIKFSLKNPHEIRVSPAEQRWACLMLLK